jgi:hypothetical protein
VTLPTGPERTEPERWPAVPWPMVDGYVHGPAAATEATARALERVAAVDPAVVVLVEGISDQIAVETLARRDGRDLEAEGVVVVPIGGAQAITAALRRFGPGGEGRRVTGLCDAGEEPVFRRGLERAGILAGAAAASGTDLAAVGFQVCVADLEDELIRAVGVEEVEVLFHRQGDLDPFRTLQKQSAWQGRDPAAQLRRFLGAGSRRKLRYARLLVEEVAPDRVPPPLRALLDCVP